MGGGRGRVFRNNYRRHVGKTKGGHRIRGGRWGWLGWGAGSGESKRQTTILNKNKIFLKRFYFCLEKGEGREKERGRNIHLR